MSAGGDRGLRGALIVRAGIAGESTAVLLARQRWTGAVAPSAGYP